jgi:threonine dehydrogenase-like Zn-dependent dehydrogenase
VIQPVATVFNALSRLNFRGKRVAVIGLGPLGVIFTHVLKSEGAKTVVGIDMVDRSDVASRYGIDELVTSASKLWKASLKEGDRPEVIIEAVGHQQHTLSDAVDALAHAGHIFAFGIPDDEHYSFPFRSFLVKDGTLHAGITREWQHFLARAEKHVNEHRRTFSDYLTSVFHVSDAEAAFNLYSRPAVGRLKVAFATSKGDVS